MKMAKSKDESLKVGFNGSLKPEFHGSRVTSDAGLLAYHELDKTIWKIQGRKYRDNNSQQHPTPCRHKPKKHTA
jgi:hypothetical protein